ncbi:MAG TPA: ROK family protein [Longimicrobiales bacterium]
MRKINTRNFRRATRSTSREINRQIVLNLVREHQPVSRADLARLMNVGRGMVTSLVNELIAEGIIYEGATGVSRRGRKPKLLHLRTSDRFVVAIDVRFSRTYVMLADFSGRQIALETFETRFDPAALIDELARRARRLLANHGAEGRCHGIGLVVPGMVDRRTGRVLNAPQLGWRDVDVRDALAAATGLPVYIENAPHACALAQMWLAPNGSEVVDNFVYVTVSDGVGAGVVLHGEIVRGHSDTAGEFGHIPLSLDGPRCLCGRRGCWEAYTSNLATLARYLRYDLSRPGTWEQLKESPLTVPELIARARVGDARARAALEETARYLGIGLAGIMNALNPARIFIGGEITEAWDLLADTVRRAAAERVLTAAAAATPIIPEEAGGYPRLRGAAALVVAPMFAAPRLG